MAAMADIKPMLDDMGDISNMAPFINKENRELEIQAKVCERKLITLESELEENVERVGSMADHLRNVQQEFQHTTQLTEAKAREIQTEDHLKQVVTREKGRLEAEMNRMKLKKSELQEKLNVIQNSLFKGNQRLDKSKVEMELDQEEMEQWILQAKQKEDDALALEKYQRADEYKVKELTLQIERLTSDEAKRKRELNSEVTETQASQIELEKTGEEFRKIHAERQELIRQWESTIEQMQARDKDIERGAEEFSSMKAGIIRKRGIVEEKEHFLEQEIANNQEADRKITVSDRIVAKFRLDQQNAADEYQQLEGELNTLRNTLNKTSMDLMVRRNEIAKYAHDISEKTRRLATLNKKKDSTCERLSLEEKKTMTSEEHGKMLEEMLKEEEAEDKVVLAELTALKEQQFKQSQKLFKLKSSEKSLTSEMLAAQCASKNLTSQIQKLDNSSIKQQELIYQIEFQIQSLERKISRLQGERTDEEQKRLNERVKVLRKTLEEHVKTNTLISTQLKRLQDDLRHAKRRVENEREKKAAIANKIDDINLNNDSAKRQLRKTVRDKEELMVEESVMKLELKRLRGLLNNRADDVFNSEKRKLKLQLEMEERTNQVRLHKEMLKTELKTGEEERHNASVELRDRLTRVEKLKKKYEIIVLSTLPEDGNDEHSQAYYIVKAAQEREELQQEGNELDLRIRKTEKEIRALENTLRLINGRNEQYRQSFSKADMFGAEIEQKTALEEQYRAAMDKYKGKRREIRELQEELFSLEKTNSMLREDETVYRQRLAAHAETLNAIAKEEEDRERKMERSRISIKKQIKEHHSMTNLREIVDGKSMDERDLMLRELRDFNTSMLTQLNSTVVQKFPDSVPIFNMLCSQNKLEIPTISRASSSRVTRASRGSEGESVRSSTSCSSTSSRRSNASSHRSAASGVGRPIREGASVSTKTLTVTLPSADSSSAQTAGPTETSTTKRVASAKSRNNKSETKSVESRPSSSSSNRSNSRRD